MKENIKAILLDFDNTLTDFHSASRQALSALHRQLDWPYDEHTYAVYQEHNRSAWYLYEKQQIDGKELRERRFRRFMSQMGLSGPTPSEVNRLYLEAVLDFTVLNEGVLDFLRKLHPRYQLGVVTNGMKEVQRRRVQKTGITPLLQSLTISDEIGVAKPDPACFDHAMSQLPTILSPSQVLMVGDGLQADIKGGKRYGMKTAWIRAEGHGRSAHADYTLRSVLELENLLVED